MDDGTLIGFRFTVENSQDEREGRKAIRHRRTQIHPYLERSNGFLAEIEQPGSGSSVSVRLRSVLEKTEPKKNRNFQLFWHFERCRVCAL